MGYKKSVYRDTGLQQRINALEDELRKAGPLAPKAQQRHVNQSTLSPRARTTWFRLCDHGNSDNATNFVTPSTKTLAAIWGVTEKTVKRGLGELLEKNWICLPEGDSGGRKTGCTVSDLRGQTLIYHLHPDGQPCSLQKHELKQRAARAGHHMERGSTCPPLGNTKGGQTGGERGTDTTVKGDKCDIAYKEGTSRMNIHERTSTSSRAREAREENGDGGVASHAVETSMITSASSREEFYAEQAQFERMEIHLEEAITGNGRLMRDLEETLGSQFRRPPRQLRIDGKVRTVIKSEVTKAGYKLAHFTYAVPWDTFKNPKVRSIGGLLMTYAKEFAERFGQTPWPECFDCEDKGEIKDPDSPWSGRAPCHCTRGEHLKADRYRHYETWKNCKEAGLPFCEECNNTGFTDQAGKNHCAHCEFGQQLRKMQETRKPKTPTREELAAQEARVERRKSLIAKHICFNCEGQSPHVGSWNCGYCCNTGEYRTDEEWTERGKCWMCCGTGRQNKASKCRRCNGTGDVTHVIHSPEVHVLEEAVRRRREIKA